MVIKNFIILEEKLNYFINEIIHELCIKNIPYLYIKEANELHFDKYIYRFHNIKQTLNIILEKPAIPQLLKDIENIIIDSNYLLSEANIPIKEEKTYLKHTKNNIKKYK